MTTLADLQRAYRDELLRHGLLISTGVDGLYGRSGLFEQRRRGLRCAPSAGSAIPTGRR